MLSSMISSFAPAALLLFGAADAAYSIETREDILTSASTLAYDLMKFYKGNQTGEIPGILPGPPDDGKGDYYWWQGGAMMGTYIDYWYYTGDESYNHVVTEGMLHQVGPGRDYMPPNHTASLGNDDQGFWGMSAMLAAENKFPDPPPDQPQWLALAQAVWTTQASPDRHDETCGGGLRWQVPPTNTGYDYKNTISNGIFFNMGARLARYTNNATYARFAEETWDWLWAVNFIDNENYRVYDGGHVPKNCTNVFKATFSYNIAVVMQGCAFMANHTGEQKWFDRTEKLVQVAIEDFFADGAAYEIACEVDHGRCSQDMLSFKGYLHRWMAVVAQLVPSTRELIRPVLLNSTQSAIKQCTGGASGRVCGFYWTSGQFVDPAVDKTSGAGEAMNVLGAVLSIMEPKPPVTNTTGGTSQGDPNAGMNSHPYREFAPITTGDKAGASILTIVVLLSAIGIWGWMSVGVSEWNETKGKGPSKPEVAEVTTSKESVSPATYK
ncbi:mannan endo-1,6-alpha-mannosidase DCW1-like protein [Colletotrichum truncatum]|uniref:Mannan endo-1,6-alpha-mannosidase DCW1-like protein n=1 Tax=Colletotrichum truncatum TaxID=5467 RepID=A0ACC3ZKW0_COLTU|nr:mannan endo-1,6-alpha-mannosidase DCW1-like protein [Colletotrichum truncatum]KAF6800093.1 mannan endo-1,6-alpha-mannosidase DCW1-like protein [Colletotrichum truncatum]